jgi:hypothetical protein
MRHPVASKNDTLLLLNMPGKYSNNFNQKPDLLTCKGYFQEYGLPSPP